MFAIEMFEHVADIVLAVLLSIGTALETPD